MKLLRSLLIFCVLFVVASPLRANEPAAVWSYAVEHEGGNLYRVTFTVDIPAGWHIYDMGPYDDPYVNVTTLGFEPGAGVVPEGKATADAAPVRKYEEAFGTEIGYYSGKASFRQMVRLTEPEATLKAAVGWTLCTDDMCTAPEEQEFEIKITAVGEEGYGPAPEAREKERPGFGPEAADPYAGEGSMWSLILAAMAWAMLALVTPCVFPMIPMTVSFFLKDSASPARARFRALMYGVFIVSLYTVPIALIIVITRFVGGEQVPADIFNWLSTHWLPNVVFFLVFMIFAASFFGAFEIVLPGKMVNSSDRQADKGGLRGVFFMALTLVLVSFACTGPIVSSAIVGSTSGAKMWEPVITMLAFSVTFAIPFTLFAFFPSLLDRLPRSGSWMNTVKVCLGFVEVALGLKFLSVADQTYHWGLLDREVYLAIWIVVFALMGFYLLGKIRFKFDSELKYVGIGRLALVILTFSFVVYLIPGMFGAPLKAISGYLPPMHTQDFVVGRPDAAPMREQETAGGKAPKYSDFLHLPHALTGFFDLDEAQAYAEKAGKPLFVDITGHGCVSCREMESRVWADPQVLEILREDYVIAAIYVDDKTRLPEDQWITTDGGRTLKSLGKINAYRMLHEYGANAQPYYLLQGRGGRLLVPPRGYNLSVAGFVEFLLSGLEAYRAE